LQRAHTERAVVDASSTHGCATHTHALSYVL
jgi:hypothetical protein